MYIDDGRVVTSASDLSEAAHCEFAVLRTLDSRLGRIDAVVEVEDAMLERAKKLGDEHERRVLAALQERFGDGVFEIERPKLKDVDDVRRAVDETVAALAGGRDVVYQAAFVADDFVGFADFLVRQPDGRYRVVDTKLARTARVTALMQLAAYADQLDRLGIPRDDTVELHLGDGTVSAHALDDVMPVFRLRWARLRQIVAEREPGLGADGAPVAWGDSRYRACGRCEWCEPEVAAHRDLLLVAGMRPTQRERLRAAGIDTIDALAAAEAVPAGMSAEVFDGLRTQARLQREGEAASDAASVDAPAGTDAAPPIIPPFRVVHPAMLAAVPPADPGDVFFDFEGDPLYTEGDEDRWGIDYLFGWVDAEARFDALWAHDFDAERQAFEGFIDFLVERRRRHPGMHVYHYAPYETSHLGEMVHRYGTRERELDQFLREGLFVDLYPVVRRSLRVGSRSYSIKALEPLYMGDESRADMSVTKGDQSIEWYLQARSAMAAGDEETVDALLGEIAKYNAYDCRSTLRLRDWLHALAAQEGVEVAAVPPEVERAFPQLDDAEAMRAQARRLDETGYGDSPDAVALRIGAAAQYYYPRERNTFWWEHFARLEQPVDVWADTRDVLVVDAGLSRVDEDWMPAASKHVRRLTLRGALAPGSTLKIGEGVFLLYEAPLPFPGQSPRAHVRGRQDATIVEQLDDGFVVEETAYDGSWDALPMALTPGWPMRTDAQEQSIAAWARSVVHAGGFPRDPASDILLRRPPARRGGGLAPLVGDDYIGAAVASLRGVDSGFLAVQGPPGTGKTYVGSRVIARLVREHGWRVGVVAQSHRVVENVLEGVVAAGLPADLVGKALRDTKPEDHSFTALAGKNGATAFASEREQSGFVLGGTAWDFANARRIPRGSLDLVVIDEAGQFSLANTIAVSLAAPRMLLLGDPQQLPQVSQGTHPEPVDVSALGWVMDGAPVLPERFGYFLRESRRMHPAVAEPVSRLSYAGELASHPLAALRDLDGVAPGLHAVRVEHQGRSTFSPEEAAAVVDIVRSVLGRGWTEVDLSAGEGEGAAADPRLPARPLRQEDVIVVTPYNAQLACVRQELDAAGLHQVLVGTVDKFQGQEAAVAVLSLAASSGADVPRGIDFLLSRNRLNVAVSRAKVAAYLLWSPGLLDQLPWTPVGVAQLSAFARLVGAEPSPTWAVPAPADVAAQAEPAGASAL